MRGIPASVVSGKAGKLSCRSWSRASWGKWRMERRAGCGSTCRQTLRGILMRRAMGGSGGQCQFCRRIEGRGWRGEVGSHKARELGAAIGCRFPSARPSPGSVTGSPFPEVDNSLVSGDTSIFVFFHDLREECCLQFAFLVASLSLSLLCCLSLSSCLIPHLLYLSMLRKEAGGCLRNI